MSPSFHFFFVQDVSVFGRCSAEVSRKVSGNVLLGSTGVASAILMLGSRQIAGSDGAPVFDSVCSADGLGADTGEIRSSGLRSSMGDV